MEIDAGIKKEVSVGCSVEKALCSVCGTDQRKESCKHRAGQRYGETLCHTVLEAPTDAYEWSFVAVPAQVGAGVVKRHGSRPQRSAEELVEVMKSAVGELRLSAAEAGVLSS